MTRAVQHILDSGERFPSLQFDTIDHGPLSVPDAFGGQWGVFLAYRAHW